MSLTRLAAPLAALTLLLLPASASAALPTTPFAGGYVTDGTVNAVTLGDDGSTYIGGDFTRVGPATGGGLVVAPDGTGAPRIGSFPEIAGTVNSSVPDGHGGWYVGGSFTTVGGLPRARLAHVRGDLSVDPDWHPDVAGTVISIALSADGGTLVATGSITAVDGESTGKVIAVDARTGALAWSAATRNGNSSTPTALAVSGASVYVVGMFLQASGESRPGAAAFDVADGTLLPWNPQVSREVQSPTPYQTVNAVAVSPDGQTVYLGGTFQRVGSSSAYRTLAAVDAVTGAVRPNWKTTGWSSSTDVRAIVVRGTRVYVGGSFGSITDSSGAASVRSRIAVLDTDPDTGGAVVLPFAPPAQTFARVNALSVSADGQRVYAGGTDAAASGSPRTVALDGDTGAATAWDPRPYGVSVNTISASGDRLYVGGSIRTAGPDALARTRLARLRPDGTADPDWAPSADATVNALAVRGDALYVGGAFTAVSGQPRNRLAAVDARGAGTLRPFDPNLDAPVSALVATPTRVYAAGGFGVAEGQPRKYLAAWGEDDALTGWDPQANGPVWALARSGGEILAAGAFSFLGGVYHPRLAAIAQDAAGTVAAWTPQVNADVNAVAASGSTVYVGGAFTDVGEDFVPRVHLAAFDRGSDAVLPWDPGSAADSVYGSVKALAVDGETLYVAREAQGSGVLYPGVLALDAATAEPLPAPPSVGYGARALTVAPGGALTVGGSFTTAGDRSVAGVARFGDADLELAPHDVDFGHERAGVATATTAITLANSRFAGAYLRVADNGIEGAHAGDFSIAGGSCPRDGGRLLVAPGDACRVLVRFKPRAEGERSARLAFETNLGEDAVPLHGVGDPPATMLPVTEVGANWAIVRGHVDPDVAEYQILHRAAGAAEWTVGPRSAATVEGGASLALSGLSPSTPYFFKVRAYMPGGGFGYSAARSFTTSALPLPPEDVVVDAPTDVTSTGAMLGATVTTHGAGVTGVVEWGTSAGDYTRSAALYTGGTKALRILSRALPTQFAPATTYHYRITVTSPAGTVSTADHTFTTAAPPAPAVTVTAVDPVASTTATVNTVVDTHGAALTGSSVQWGTTTAYGRSLPLLSSVLTEGGRIYLRPLQSLKPGTTYHYRVTATTPFGTTATEDRTFTTTG